jgi:copper chaperone
MTFRNTLIYAHAKYRNMAIRKLKIEGMKCENCSKKTHDALAAIPGVSDVKVDLAKGMAAVTCDDGVKDEDLCMAVLNVGFKAKVKHGLF